MFIKLSSLRKLIREEIGRNFKSLDVKPYTFEDFADYNIQITGSNLDGFFLTIHYKNEKIFPTTKFQNRNEAHHKSRMVIDNHRVSIMNGENS